MTENWTPATIDVAGHRIAALLRGSDSRLPAVIFIHGITASIDFWPAVLDSDADQFRSCSLSLPGHWPSTTSAAFSQTDVTCQLFAEIVGTAAATFFAGETPHLVGWSTGGFAALAAAAEYPAAFASVCSISGFARGQWGDLLGLLQWLAAANWSQSLCRRILTQLGRSPWLLDRILNRFCGTRAIRRSCTTVGHDAAQAGWNSLHAAARQNDPRVLTSLLHGLRAVDLTNRLPLITVPTRIIGGAADPVIRPDEARHLASNLDSAELVAVAECGHMFFAEAREEVLNLVSGWIRSHPDSTSLYFGSRP